MLIRRILVAVLCLPLVAASPSQVPVDGYKIVHTYPHDPNSFTQGLVFVDGHLYESTGRNGHSSLRMVDLSTGWVLKEYDLPEEYFGEGVTDWRDTLIQLTWISGVAFVYDRSTFTVRRTLHYTGEGWGLTHDSSALILSDGTPTLRFLDPNSFREIKKINVRDGSNQPSEISTNSNTFMAKSTLISGTRIASPVSHPALDVSSAGSTSPAC
jgi:glutamine cyclotransferase